MVKQSAQNFGDNFFFGWWWCVVMMMMMMRSILKLGKKHCVEPVAMFLCMYVRVYVYLHFVASTHRIGRFNRFNHNKFIEDCGKNEKRENIEIKIFFGKKKKTSFWYENEMRFWRNGVLFNVESMYIQYNGQRFCIRSVSSIGYRLRIRSFTRRYKIKAAT